MLFEVHGDSFTAYLCAVGCVVLAACFYSFARSRITQISLEAVIGISYAIAAAGALFLVGIAPGSHMHIQHILSGSLLWTGRDQILICFVTFSVIGICLFLVRRPIAGISEHYRNGTGSGFGFIVWDFIFYVLLGIVITVSVQIAGVIVVFAYLIIPATIAAAVTSRRRMQTAVIWTAAVAASLCGLLFAYYLDFSVGPSIALFLGVELVLVSVTVRFLSKCHGSTNT